MSTINDNQHNKRLLEAFKEEIGVEEEIAKQIENKINDKINSTHRMLYDMYMSDLEELHRSGDAQGMINVAKKVLDLFPTESAVYGYLGDAYIILEQRKEALNYYEKAIELGQESPYLFFNYAVVLGEEGLVEQAKANFRKVIEINTEFWQAYYTLGRIFNTEKKYLEALEMLEKSLEYNPGYTDAMLLLAIAYSETGNLMKAIKRSQDVRGNVDFLLDNQEVKDALIVSIQKIGDHIEDQIASSKKELLSNPSNIQLYHTLSVCSRIMGDRENAIQYLLKAINVKPEDGEAFSKLVDLFQEDQNIQGIPRSLNDALKSNLNDPCLWIILGMIQNSEGTSPEELLSYLKAKDLGMESSFLSEHISRVYFDMENTEKALEHAIRAIELNENNVEALQLYAEILLTLDHANEAIEQYEKVLLLQPENSGIMMQLVLRHIEIGNLDRALELAKIASEKDQKYEFLLIWAEDEMKKKRENN